MLVQFGFVAMAPSLAAASPSRTLTATAAEQMDAGDRLYRLRRLTGANLEATLRILRHAHAHGVGLYRFSSRLVPLATHPLTQGWDWAGDFADAFAALGEFVRRHGMRVSFHPDHYAPFSSPRPEVQAAARRDYVYHTRMIAAMGLTGRVRLVMHIGGAYGDPQAALETWVSRTADLEDARHVLAVENDDRVYDGATALALARRTSVPLVLDFHHQRLLRGEAGLVELVSGAAATWTGGPPKFHLSSAASPHQPRAHADFIAVDDATLALTAIRQAGLERADMMVEAKAKDAAVFRLVGDLAATGRWIPEGAAAIRSP